MTRFVKTKDQVDFKYELACDSVTLEAVDLQDAFSCFVAGDTGIVS